MPHKTCLPTTPHSALALPHYWIQSCRTRRALVDSLSTGTCSGPAGQPTTAAADCKKDPATTTMMAAAMLFAASSACCAAASDDGTTLDGLFPRISPNIILIGVGARHNRSDGPPTPYMFANRTAAGAACRRTGDYTRLCNKAELLGFSTCANGWCADWEGYWIVSKFRLYLPSALYCGRTPKEALPAAFLPLSPHF